MSSVATKQRGKVALVLAAGGITGAVYEIGALCALDDRLNDRSITDFDVYVGTSAGALVAACVANGISPHQMMQVLDTALPGMQRLEPHHMFELNLQTLLLSSLRLPTRLVETLLSGFNGQVMTLFDRLAASLPSGLYSGTALESYLREAFALSGRANDFRELRHELVLVATDLDSGDRALFGEPPLDTVPISLAVAASTALPLFYQPVRIDGNDYVDGAVRGTVSLDVAVEHGAELIICVNPLVPIDTRKLPLDLRLGENGPVQVSNQVFRTWMYSGLQYHLKQIRRQHPHVKILMIEPERNDLQMFTENPMSYEARLRLARHGYETVSRQLEQQSELFHDVLADFGMSFSRRPMFDHAFEESDVGRREAMAALSVPPLMRGPAALVHTLGELERVLNRLNGSARV